MSFEKTKKKKKKKKFLSNLPVHFIFLTFYPGTKEMVIFCMKKKFEKNIPPCFELPLKKKTFSSKGGPSQRKKIFSAKGRPCEKIFPRKDLFFPGTEQAVFVLWKKKKKKKKKKESKKNNPCTPTWPSRDVSRYVWGFFSMCSVFLFPFFLLLFSFFFIKEEVSFTTQEVKVVLLWAPGKRVFLYVNSTRSFSCLVKKGWRLNSHANGVPLHQGEQNPRSIGESDQLLRAAHRELLLWNVAQKQEHPPFLQDQHSGP